MSVGVKPAFNDHNNRRNEEDNDDGAERRGHLGRQQLDLNSATDRFDLMSQGEDDINDQQLQQQIKMQTMQPEMLVGSHGKVRLNEAAKHKTYNGAGLNATSL